MPRLVSALAFVIVVLAACGNDGTSAPATTTTTTATTTTIGPPESTIDAVRVWIQTWYDDAYERDGAPPGVTGPAQVACDGTGPVDVGSVLVCRLVPQTEPDVPLETASLALVVLDVDGRSTWSTGTDLPTSSDLLLEIQARAQGMGCDDLFSGAAPHPFAVAGTTPENGFFWTLVYWLLEGRPTAMDPDGDAAPCGSFFEPGVVAAVLAGGPAEPQRVLLTPADLLPGDVLVAGEPGVAVVRDGGIAGTVWAEPTRVAHHLRDEAGILVEPADGGRVGADRIVWVDSGGKTTDLPGLTPGERYRLFGTAWTPVEGELIGAEAALVGEVDADGRHTRTVVVGIANPGTRVVADGANYGEVTAVSYDAAGFVISHTTPAGAALLSFVTWDGRPDEYAWPVWRSPDASGHQREGAFAVFVPSPTWAFLVHVEPAADDPNQTMLVVTTLDPSTNTTERALELEVTGADLTVTAVDAERGRAVVSRADRASGEPARPLIVDLTTGETTDLPISGRASLVALEPCSAWGLERPGPQEGLPAATATTRDEILDAALACDYDRLDELTRTGTNDFYATDINDYWHVPPGEFWANAEAQGRDSLAELVHDLSQTPELTEWYGVGASYRWIDRDECLDYGGMDLCRSADITPDGEWLGWLRESP